MDTVTSEDVKRTFVDTIRKAQRSPVQITSYGRPIAVIMSVENYQMTEELKMRYLKERISRAHEDIKHGRMADGDAFLDKLLTESYE